MNDSLVRVLLKLRTSWLTAVMAFGGPTVAQLYRMVELMNPGRIVDIMILMGTNNASKSSDAENSLRVNAGVPVYHSVAKNFSVRYRPFAPYRWAREHNRPQEEDTMNESLDGTTSCEIWQAAMLDE